MILPSLRATVVLLALCCVAYPAVVTGIGQLAFHDAANGSLLRGRDGRVTGSALVGQSFTSPKNLQGRPSAVGYDASTSGGSNFGPGSQKLADRRAEDERRLRQENPDAAGPVPELLLAASASGLDPDLSPEAARWQLPRIAKARGVDVARVEAVLDELVQGRDLGLLGEERVNVLELNLALDRRLPAHP